ncbi:MAG: phage holin family protein [Acidobacteria bacterium]|nr:phage holin family protein [Acidobacteriota bacterium]
MRRLVLGWADLARSVGSALLEVWQAEIGALRQDLSRSGRALRGGLILALAAAVVGFWSVGLGLWLVVEVLTLRLPRWQAALVVLAAGLVLAFILGWIARRSFERIEAPLHLVKRRSREHLEWWQETVLPELVPGQDEDRSEAGEQEGDDEAR